MHLAFVAWSQEGTQNHSINLNKNKTAPNKNLCIKQIELVLIKRTSYI